MGAGQIFSFTDFQGCALNQILFNSGRLKNGFGQDAHPLKDFFFDWIFTKNVKVTDVHTSHFVDR